MNTYIEQIEAIQWDGTDEVFNQLTKIFDGFVRIWRVKDSSLRLNNIQYQGDHWVDVGDYIIMDIIDGIKKSRVMVKDRFEAIYRKA